MKRLSENLKLIRKKRWNISQDSFAKLMNSTRSKINSYENGGVEPSIAFMIQLQAYTNINVKDIFTSILVLEKIPQVPLSGEAKELTKMEDEESNYEQTFKDLNKFGYKLSKQFKSLEQRIENLEIVTKNLTN